MNSRVARLVLYTEIEKDLEGHLEVLLVTNSKAEGVLYGVTSSGTQPFP